MEIRSVSEELQELGIVIPDTSSARVAIREFLLDARLTDQDRANRLELFRSLQKQYIGKDFYREASPRKIGQVDHIRPVLHKNMRAVFSDKNPERIKSVFQAYLKWHGSKTGVYLRLDQIVPLFV